MSIYSSKSLMLGLRCASLLMHMHESDLCVYSIRSKL
jgi:hypothetical protein